MIHEEKGRSAVRSGKMYLHIIIKLLMIAACIRFVEVGAGQDMKLREEVLGLGLWSS